MLDDFFYDHLNDKTEQIYKMVLHKIATIWISLYATFNDIVVIINTIHGSADKAVMGLFVDVWEEQS